MTRLAAIFGCAGPSLTADEAAFFRDARPWGFILFRRNVESPDQLRALTAALRETVGDAAAPVLVDQEGGRVQRLGPPHWPKYPPARAYGEAVRDLEERRALVRLGARLIAHDLTGVGINVDCVPVLDVPSLGAHDIIGDRAYADTPRDVATLGRAAADGLLAGGVLPVIKHLPGHGRAMADSHESLPVVNATAAALAAHDFVPFRLNADLPLAMTAHVVYAAIDPDNPATTSAIVIRDIIRGEIGFDGLLMTDDLSMKALGGSFEDRTSGGLAAGCDVVLHCNGAMDEMRAVAAGAAVLAGESQRRADAALGRLAAAAEPFDADAARVRFAAAFEGRWAA
jgi:beta-N-acetylhexosaminidase